MRTDIITDHRQVRCPNSSSLGYSMYTARVGDFVFWHESTNMGNREQLGRMLARITWTSDEGKCTYILVAILHESSFVSERWVRPVDVTRVYRQSYFIPKAREAMRLFLGGELRKRAKRDLTDTRACVSEMWSSFKRYDDWKANRERTIKGDKGE